MARKRSLLGNIAASAQRKATNSAKQAAYISMWGEEPPKGKKKVKAS